LVLAPIPQREAQLMRSTANDTPLLPVPALLLEDAGPHPVDCRAKDAFSELLNGLRPFAVFDADSFVVDLFVETAIEPTLDGRADPVAILVGDAQEARLSVRATHEVVLEGKVGAPARRVVQSLRQISIPAFLHAVLDVAASKDSDTWRDWNLL